ncbi:uncharacterized protein BDZ99DRAFT_459296 [Mytilinidion resinicola]|uniref:DUF1989 domain-containing protein n=1 Tax=Mytilinidion resinicola TaxID=574789 RepID=A0A6A6Z354_9PEZI|nr:uncharacterized protein BDZ99DRAFT_459296 [Mytilinidion resinicola]KAF2815430.1 hypothetical protein BDZ99DRAFT_459296 [Mytilinidion resinicola]
MSGELQTIPARHGVATFVPRGRTIKIINTYGKQVVSTWAFALHQPPEKDKKANDEANAKEAAGEEVVEEKADGDGKVQESEKVEEEVEKPKEEAKDAEESAEDPPEEAPDDAEKTTKKAEENADDPPDEAPDDTTKKVDVKKADTAKAAKTWSSYLPSIPYRSKAPAALNKDAEAEKSENEATSKKWSSYIPTGQGFSSYIPNVQMPSKESLSAFAGSHYRDPNKSYAEQLYEFSKTPVGAGGIAAASGSGTASSLYAAYSAYTKLSPKSSNLPPMEYLSLPHTRASSHRLVPQAEDTLLTNLRTPILTLIEDTTTGAHDTLTAACDASLYATLGVEKAAEHGSCAENLVLALKELNEKAGLQGEKAVGADVTVNIAPTPLHLFMNAPIEVDSAEEGSGAKGVTFKIAEPAGKKRTFVRFRAERDVVVVMSACPMDVGSQNGGKCMAANFVVEVGEEEEKTGSPKSEKATPNQKGKPAKLQTAQKAKKEKDEEKIPEEKSEEAAGGKPMPKPKGGPAKIQAIMKQKQERDAEEKGGAASPSSGDGKGTEEEQKPKKKPKKLERRT